MSTSYKVKKYINKLASTNDPKKMDLYYEKIKKYKLMQSGGALPENLKSAFSMMSNKLDQIKRASEKQQDLPNLSKENIQKLHQIKDGYLQMSGDFSELVNKVGEIAKQFDINVSALNKFALPDNIKDIQSLLTSVGETTFKPLPYKSDHFELPNSMQVSQGMQSMQVPKDLQATMGKSSEKPIMVDTDDEIELNARPIQAVDPNATLHDDAVALTRSTSDLDTAPVALSEKTKSASDSAIKNGSVV